MKFAPRLLVMIALVTGALAVLAPFAFAAPAAQNSNKPVVVIDRPASNTIFAPGETVTVTSTSASSVGIVKVEMFVDGVSVEADTTPGGLPQVPQFKIDQRWTAVAGQHIITVVATDRENVKSDPAAINVIVSGTPTPQTAPTLQPVTVTPTPGTNACTLSARFVRDVSIPDRTQMAAGTLFTKTWAIQNNGTCAWGPGYSAVFAGREQMGGTANPIPFAQPGETVNVSVNFVAPAAPGQHVSDWRMRAANGELFGQRFYALIQVPGLPTPIAPPTPIPPPPTPRPQGCQGAPVITGFFVNPSNIRSGETATLHWNLVANADYASLETPDGTSGIATPGNQNVSPRRTATYTLAAYCKGNRVTSQVTVNVSNPPPPTPPFKQNEVSSVVGQRRDGGIIRIRVNYYWNGQDAPATMQGVGWQNGRINTNGDVLPIVAGSDQVITLHVNGGLKINEVYACLTGHSGTQIACKKGPVQ